MTLLNIMIYSRQNVDSSFNVNVSTSSTILIFKAYQEISGYLFALIEK